MGDLRAQRGSKRKRAKLGDEANFDIIDAVIGIAIFAATIGLIGSQITSAGANLTAFPGASTPQAQGRGRRRAAARRALLYPVPLIRVAILAWVTGGGVPWMGRRPRGAPLWAEPA